MKIFFYSQVIWDDVWQRPQEFAINASKKVKITYFSPISLHRYVKVYRKIGVKLYKKINENLEVFSPIISPGYYRNPLIKKFNDFYLKYKVFKILKNDNYTHFFTNSPFIWTILKDINIPVIYDIIDDFVKFSWAPKGADKEEIFLFQKAKLCFTGTYTLYERKNVYHKNIHFIPCGVNFEKFYKPIGSVPQDIKKIPKPIIGYYGTISDRLNKEIIKMLSKEIPEANIVLIGPVQSSFGEIIKASNIHYLGLKPHDELPLYLKYFDVCILPFNLDEGTKSINPVKLLEYLSGGKIVISTPIPDIVRFYSDIVFIENSVTLFVKRVKEQLNNPDISRIKKGIEFAKNKSWIAMTNRMLEMMKDI